MIWTKAGGRAGRPAVRVFTGVGGSAGGVVADAKPQTDALLVVEAVPGASGRAGLATNLLTSIGAISVTDASGLEVGDPVVRLTIQVPRAPTLADVKERLVMANGFENMQIDCLLDDGGGGFSRCGDGSNPAPVLPGGDPVTVESAAAFGAFGTEGGRGSRPET